MNNGSRAVDGFYLWVGRHPSVFVASVVTAAMLAVGAVVAAAVNPPHVVSTESAFISESSRDIDGSPKAVAELRDGSKVFVSGVYVAGDPVTLNLDADGDVITYEPAVYWIFAATLMGLFGFLSFVGAAFFRLHVIDSERMWRLDRRLYYGAVQ